MNVSAEAWRRQREGGCVKQCLDDILTQIPPGWDLQLSIHATTDGASTAVLTDLAFLDEETNGKLFQGDGKTPALAILAAIRSLKTEI